MPTLYVLEPDARIEKEYGRILVTKDDAVLVRVPLKNISGVVIVGNAGATTQALHALLQQGAPLILVKRSGDLVGKLVPPTAYNLPLRQAQYQRNADAQFAFCLAREIVAGKIRNQSVFAGRLARRKGCDLPENLAQLKSSQAAARACADMRSLLGVEGNAARCYFEIYQGAFDPSWQFTRRTRRPPRDAVNALLSLGYTFLGHAVEAALEIAGLDPYLGYFHQEAYGRPALALDLIEEWRAPVVDSLVLGLINKKLLQPEDFEPGQDDGVFLTQAGMRVFVREFRDKLESRVTWRRVGRALSYRKLFEVQAQAIRRLVLGEETSYHPFEAR